MGHVGVAGVQILATNKTGKVSGNERWPPSWSVVVKKKHLRHRTKKQIKDRTVWKEASLSLNERWRGCVPSRGTRLVDVIETSCGTAWETLTTSPGQTEPLWDDSNQAWLLAVIEANPQKKRIQREKEEPLPYDTTLRRAILNGGERGHSVR